MAQKQPNPGAGNAGAREFTTDEVDTEFNTARGVNASPARLRAKAILEAWDGIIVREDAACFVDFAVRDLGAGEPLPAFTTIAAEAENWAAIASLAELRAYFAAILARLPAADRKRWISAARRASNG